MSIVQVYHGTTIDRAKQIIKSGLIKRTSQDCFRHEDTAQGYVYVTKRLCDALDFSTKPEVGKDTLVFAVFKILIDESELIPDKDEAKWKSTLSEDGEKDCYKIGRDLIIGTDVVAFWCAKMISYERQGVFMQAIQYGEKEIKESEWRNLCHD